MSKDSIVKMDYLINDLTSYDETEFDGNTDIDSLSFTDLRSDPGRIGLESVFREVNKLKTIRELELPDNLFNNIPEKILKKYKLRAVSEDLRELRRHPEPLRYTLLSAFFWLRCREINDNLIELLIQIIHRISVRAERKVEKEFINDFRRVNGKTNILFQMADAALNNPDGIVKQVLYPVINALELIKKSSYTTNRFFLLSDDVPIEGVVKAKLKDAVIEKDEKGKERINRINYEIVTLQSLRDKLRCKEIWVVGANRYRNPDEDLPTDFEERREENYKALSQPLDKENL